ncbi:DUF1214 domain-containing protein [Bradyrhizobium sp. UFLA05-153]
MKISRRQAMVLLGGSAALPLFSTASLGQAGDVPDDRTIADAYIYLLGRMLVIRQEHIERGAPGFSYNTISATPIGATDFVNPNLDTAYLQAWFAVDENTPIILEVPEIRGRYYTAQVLDEWGEVIANINERMFPSKPFGNFALVYPNSRPAIPADAARIELHSSKAKLLGRVEIKDDREGAERLYRAFRATVPGTPRITPAQPIKMFDNKDLMGVEIFDDVDATLAGALDVAPNAAALQQKARAVAAHVASGPQARSAVDAQIRKVAPEFIDYVFTRSTPYRNHWAGGGGSVGGNYGPNYRVRTAANYLGIWANTNDEAIYFFTTRDANEQALNGSNSYVMHFPADKLPETVVNAFWSIILVDVPGYRVVPNPLNRFNLNNYSPLRKETDGSLKIAIGPSPVAGVAETNWLPSPDGKPFQLTFRTYVPKDIVTRGEWTPPAATKVT